VEDSLSQGRPDPISITLTRSRLSIDEAAADVMRGNVGAVSIFVGTTRAITEGRSETVRLEYDCYEQMAVQEIRRICSQAIARWTLQGVFVAHRLGEVPVGEASIVIAASSAHRLGAIEACRFVIDTLKQSVPIWKKEVYADGRTDWIRGSEPDDQGV
jgi:molybdopterin synthase catalytic subunit